MFISKFPDAINGSISCFDRVVFKGHLPISWGKRFMGFLYDKGVLFKNADAYSKEQGKAVVDSMEAWAQRTGRPSIAPWPRVAATSAWPTLKNAPPPFRRPPAHP